MLKVASLDFPVKGSVLYIHLIGGGGGGSTAWDIFIGL